MRDWLRVPRWSVCTVALLVSLNLQSCTLLRPIAMTKSPEADLPFELVSTAGINYRPLQTMLERQQWQEADQETFRVLLKVSQREAEGWLDQASVKALSCSDLHTLATLWSYYSENHFGFVRQQWIWQEIGGVVGNYTAQAAEQFGDRVGWRKEGQWLTYDQLNFSAMASPGHLPATTGNGVSGGVWGGVPAITFRLEYCRLADALEQGQWVEADWETLKLFEFHAYRMPQVNSLSPAPLSVDKIPCHELKAVDRLWLEYSKGRFGLSVQTDVLKKTGNYMAELDWNRYEQFEQAVGWVIAPHNDSYNGADPKAIPVGHFPYRLGYSYETSSSGFNRTWRLSLNPSCGF